MDLQTSSPETPFLSANNAAAPPPDASSRRRRVLQAAAPIALIAAIMTAMRLVANNEAADAEQAARRMRQRTNAAAVAPALKDAVAVPVGGLPYGAPQPSRLADASTAKKVIGAISNQLSAIQKGDFKKALAYSTLEMREHTTPESFEEMISRGYQPMRQEAKVEYGQVRVSGDSAMLTVILKPKGAPQTLYRYILISPDEQKGRGEWYVTGVSEDLIPGFGSSSSSLPDGSPMNGGRPMSRPPF